MAKLMFPALCALAILSSCNSTTEQDSDGIKILTSVNGLARSTDSAFEGGDKISVYAYTKGSDPKSFKFDNNVHSTTNGVNWTAATPMEWLPADHSKEFNFFAIHPADLNVAGNQLDKVNFTLSSSISNDVLVAATNDVTALQNTVGLTFGHIMSKLTVKLTYNSEFLQTPTVASVELMGLKSKAMINMFGKSFSSLSTPVEKAMSAVVVNKEYNTIAIPQTVGAAAAMIQIMIDSKKYVYTPAEAIVLKGNKHTTLALKVGANGTIELGSITIDPWGEEEEIGGNAPQDK